MFSKFCLFLLLAGTAFISCSKSDDSTNNFSWNYEGVTYTANFNEANINSSGPRTITGAVGTSNISYERKVDVVFTSFDIGNYDFASSSNAMRYVNETGQIFGSDNGSLSITSNKDNMLSGSFTGFVVDYAGILHPISGSFRNVSIKP